jgi:hypothetical protein
MFFIKVLCQSRFGRAGSVIDNFQPQIQLLCFSIDQVALPVHRRCEAPHESFVGAL